MIAVTLASSGRYVATIRNADFLRLVGARSMREFPHYREWLRAAKRGHGNPIFYEDRHYRYACAPGAKADGEVVEDPTGELVVMLSSDLEYLGW